MFAGKDPSRALATSSLKPEDCVPDWSDLDDSQKTVLGEWSTFFSKRYNVVGQVSVPQLQEGQASAERRLIQRQTDHRCHEYRIIVLSKVHWKSSTLCIEGGAVWSLIMSFEM